MTERERMLKKIQGYTLALTDANLFLDTHPDSRPALAYIKKQRALYAQAAAEFEAKYGPLTSGSADGETWNWVDRPWPWEFMD